MILYLFFWTQCLTFEIFTFSMPSLRLYILYSQFLEIILESNTIILDCQIVKKKGPKKTNSFLFVLNRGISTFVKTRKPLPYLFSAIRASISNFSSPKEQYQKWEPSMDPHSLEKMSSVGKKISN